MSACANEEPKANAAFFPLTVDYREYTYAAGKFPGGFIKREGRPSEKEILTSRLIDRPIRPLFPEGYMNESQVIAMVLSADPKRDPEHAGHHRRGRRAGHFRHSLPSCVGRRSRRFINGKLVANPSYDETRESKLNIVVAGTEEGIVMVEAGAQQPPKTKSWPPSSMAMSAARKSPRVSTNWCKGGKTKRTFKPPETNKDALRQIEAQIRKDLTDALDTKKYPKLESYHRIHDAKKRPWKRFAEEQQDEGRRAVRQLEGAHLPR